MSTFPELNSLFAKLASNLQATDPTTEHEVDLSISNLNRILNLSEAPRGRVLDAALSLMCFTAPQVYDSGIEFTLRTIIAVLFSSIECKVLKVNEVQDLRVGGLISKRDSVDVMEWCNDILRKLNVHKGDLCALLLYNVIQVAVLARSFPSVSNLNMNLTDSSACALSILRDESTFENGKVPLRLLLWQLDPIILKQDVSEILRETMERPFLSVSMEIYDRMEWKSIMICLVISPSMFIETMALLHNWFLMTGLASIMELQTQLVEQLLDIISRPMRWNISMEIGSKLPFSHAYFPQVHSLFRALAGPVSQEHIELLLAKIHSLVVSIAGGRKTTTKINVVDHKSIWATVMNFPVWFFFASMLLFSNTSQKEKTCPAKFIAWILDPTKESSQSQVVDYLVKSSDLRALGCSSSSEKHDETKIHKPSRRIRLHNKNGLTSHDLDSFPIRLWLKEFQDTYTKISGTKVALSTRNSKGFIIQQNRLFQMIPLGILLASPNHLSGACCSLLLHYAATGYIYKSHDVQYSGMSQKRWKNDVEGEDVTWTELYSKPEAVAGCKMVFDITDISESISQSIFQSEDEGLDFVGRLKLKTCYYLLQCVDRLLEIELESGGLQIQKDLLDRIIRWRGHGKNVFDNNKDLDRVCDALKCGSRFLVT